MQDVGAVADAEGFADVVVGDQHADTAVFQVRDVRIDQGSLMIRADRGEFEQKEGEVNRVVLDGAPVHLEQDIDNQGRLKADAKRIEYLLSEQKVVMTGGVRIERPRGVLTGERVVYHLDSGEMEAGEPGGRVNMTIAPKPKAAKPATEAPKS